MGKKKEPKIVHYIMPLGIMTQYISPMEYNHINCLWNCNSWRNNTNNNAGIDNDINKSKNQQKKKLQIPLILSLEFLQQVNYRQKMMQHKIIVIEKCWPHWA